MGLFIVALLAKKRGWYIACIVVNIVSVLYQLIVYGGSPDFEFNPVGLFFIMIYITVCCIKLGKIEG